MACLDGIEDVARAGEILVVHYGALEKSHRLVPIRGKNNLFCGRVDDGGRVAVTKAEVMQFRQLVADFDRFFAFGNPVGQPKSDPLFDDACSYVLVESLHCCNAYSQSLFQPQELRIREKCGG